MQKPKDVSNRSKRMLLYMDYVYETAAKDYDSGYDEAVAAQQLLTDAFNQRAFRADPDLQNAQMQAYKDNLADFIRSGGAADEHGLLYFSIGNVCGNAVEAWAWSSTISQVLLPVFLSHLAAQLAACEEAISSKAALRPLYKLLVSVEAMANCIEQLQKGNSEFFESGLVELHNVDPMMTVSELNDILFSLDIPLAAKESYKANLKTQKFARAIQLKAQKLLEILQ